MKKITIIFLLALSFGYAQSLPLDFESPEDDSFVPFGGATSFVIEDPTDATNLVLELAGSGAPFDGASISLDTYVDLSDDSNNTVSLRIWAPDADERTHLLKLEGGSSGAVELPFNTDMMGWQIIEVDFGPGLGSEFPILTLFPDFNNNQVGTYYVDDIDGPNGEVVPGPIPDIETPAPNPTAPDAEVLSIFSDTGGFTNIWVPDYSFGEADIVDLGQDEINETIKIDFSIAGWGQGQENTSDISQYNWVHFDYYVDDRFEPGEFGEQVVFILIDNDGQVVEYNFELTLDGVDGTLELGSWVGVNVPLSFFEDKGFSKSAFFQYKLGTFSDLYSKVVYFDNIYFSENEPTLGQNDFRLSEISIYPNPATNVINVESSSEIDNLKVFNLLGQAVIDIKSPSKTIDISELNSGVYLVRLTYGQQNLTKRLIIK